MGASCCAIRAVDREYAASAYGGYTHPTGTATAAEHTGAYTAGTGPSCLCPANCKNGHISVTDHVGAAAAYHSDRAIGRKCTASAHGRYTHPVRTKAAAARISDHAAGAGPPRLCSADRKNSYDGTVDHAGTVTTAGPHSDRAIDGKYAATAHGRCAHPARSEAAAERTNANTAGTGATRVCAAGKEIPC